MSNFALFAAKIKKKVPSLLTNQHLVILPSVLLTTIMIGRSSLNGHVVLIEQMSIKILFKDGAY